MCHASKKSGPDGVTSTVPALTKSDLLTKGHVMAKGQSTVTYREVPDFPGYRVGDDGSVWSKLKNTKNAEVIDGWHEVIGAFGQDGYRKVILSRNGYRKYFRVNVLVLITFVGPPPSDMNYPTAAHENGNRTDNRLANLRWASQKSNIADKIRHGTNQCGERSGNAILNDQIVIEIRARRAAGERGTDIARTLGISPVTVSSVYTRRSWRHVA